MLALSFLLLIGMALVADALHFHIPRNYLYFAIAFSRRVEMLNRLADRHRKRRRKKRLDASRAEELLQQRPAASASPARATCGTMVAGRLREEARAVLDRAALRIGRGIDERARRARG